jgi:competence protein ComEC
MGDSAGISWASLGKRPIFFPVIFFLSGVALGPSTEVSGWPFLTATAGLLVFAWCWNFPGRWLALLVGMVTGGLALSTFEARSSVPSASGEVQLEGELEQVQGTRLTVRLSALEGRPARARVLLHVEGLANVFPGQRILASAKLKSVDTTASNPGEDSRGDWLRRRGIALSGGCPASRVVLLSPASSWERWLESERSALTQAVKTLAPGEDAAALYLTLAAGERAALDDSLEEDFAHSGLAHVLSVSGLHVAALALVLMAVLKPLVLWVPWRRLRRVDPRRLAAPAALPLLWGYVAFTGWQPPAVRSAVMTSLLLGGLALHRRSDPLNALALAALAVGTVTPAAVADLSLRLSFLAVLSLILLAPALRDALPVPLPSPGTTTGWRLRLQRLRESLLQTFCASLAVTLASAPVLAESFHRVGLAGLVSNVVCLPLCGILTVLAAGGAALFVVSPILSVPVLWLGGWGSQLLVEAARFFARMPLASMDVPAPTALMAIGWLVGLLCFAIAKGKARWLGLLAPAALIFLVVGSASAPLEVTFLSVGHGDAIVVSSLGEHALIDGGGVPNGTDTGRRFVIPFLKQRRIGRLKLAALSHPHPDHALGLASAMSATGVDRVWLPAGAGDGVLTRLVRAAARGAPVEEVEVGHPPFSLGAATIEILGPPKDRVLLEGVNDQSMVLRVRHQQVTLLLTGDVEAAGEELLSPGDTTVLKAPHHGSRTSSSEAFIGRVKPRHVIFCVGRNNRFGFPHPEVEGRYRASGARCYRTDLDGAVTVKSDGREVTVETFRERAKTDAAP